MRRTDSIVTLALLGVLVLAACAPSASATTDWIMEISAEMAGDPPITSDLTYGVSSSATDGFDEGLDANAPPDDPSGFKAYFNEPGVGTGKLTVNMKSLDTIKDWTLKAVVPETKTATVSWMPGDILSNVKMEMRELVGGEPTGPVIDMKTQGLITIDGGEDGVTKKYRITATTSEAAEPPELVSCVIDPTPPVVQGTNVSVDCLFSEKVQYEIRIENDTGLVEEIGSGTATNPNKKWWYTTTETPAGTYIVNMTMYNSTTGLSSYNDTNTIEVTGCVMSTFYRDADGDGYGNESDSTEACSAPTGYVSDNTDCDDTNAAVNPGATEVCNGIDDDCDGDVDEGCPTTEWIMEMSAEMAGDPPITADLTYGVSSSATDGFDEGLDANAPPDDPSGFKAYFNEPGVGTGKLTVNMKSLDTIKDWTLKAVVPETKTVNVSWIPGDILSNVEMAMQELVGGEPTGPVIDMKTQGLITIDGGEDGVTKKYRITATTSEAAEPPELVSCVIDPAPPVVQGTNVSVDCLFSERVEYEIRIENDTGLVEEIGSGTATNPNKKWWNTTTETPAGTYIVNVTMYNSTTGLSSYNNTNTIEVTSPHPATIVSIGSAEGGVGDAVSVSIDITGASAIGAMDINIAYDPSILSGRDVANGSMIENLPDLQVAYHISSGMINISFATYPDTIDGDGELFIVTFDVIGGDAGDSTTTLLKVDAYTTDDPPQSVEVETENGVVNVTGAADTTAPTITSAIASPNAILSDGIDSTTLRVSAIDDVGITSVTVDLSAIGGSDEQLLESAGGDIWETTINTTCDGTFELPVTVSDAAGNPDTANIVLTAGPYKYTLQLKKGWNMISLPYNITAVGIGTTQKLGDAITAAGEPCYVVSWFNATSQMMESDIIIYPEGVPQDPTYPITGGQGYFVLVEDDLDFVAAGTLW